VHEANGGRALARVGLKLRTYRSEAKASRGLKPTLQGAYRAG
jgi:hypothetical protein